jgi:hypothetical protein
MLNAISLVIEQRKDEFDRIAKVWFSPSICMPCEGDHFPDTCQDLYLAERVISQVLKTSQSVLGQAKLQSCNKYILLHGIFYIIPFVSPRADRLKG